MDSKIQKALDRLRDAVSRYEDVREGPALRPSDYTADDMRDAARSLDDMVQTGGVIANVIVFLFTFTDGAIERQIYMAEDGYMKASERAIATAMLREDVHGPVTYWTHAPGTVTW